jgi:hypothetical protein
MPGKVDAVGCPPVKTLEPGAQEVSAAGMVTGLKEHMRDGVRGNGVRRAQRQGALCQATRLLRVPCFVVRKGILAQEGPIISIGRLDALHQREQGRRETGHTGTTAAEHKQALGQPDHQHIPWVLGQVFADKGIGTGTLAVDE